MKNNPKKKPEIEPEPKTSPVVPLPPEIIPEPEKPDPLPRVPETKPLPKKETEPIKDNNVKSQKNIYMNEVIKTIFERRAVRKYKKKTVSKDIIQQLIDAGKMAPFSH